MEEQTNEASSKRSLEEDDADIMWKLSGIPGTPTTNTNTKTNCTSETTTPTNSTPTAAKSPKLVSTSISSLLATSAIKIKKLQQMKNSDKIEDTLIAIVAGMTARVPTHPLVTQNRRRVVLLDDTGIISGYCNMPDARAIRIGDMIALKHFSLSQGRFTIHKNSTMGKSRHVTLRQEELTRAAELLCTPLRPFVSISQVLHSVVIPGNVVSVKGEITKVHKLSEVPMSKSNPLGPKIVKREIIIEELKREVSIQVTLWNESALYEAQVGQMMQIHDTPVKKNDVTGQKYLSVQTADNTVFFEPKTIVQEVTIITIDNDPDDTDYLRTILKYKDKSRTRIISQEVLCASVPTLKNSTQEELKALIPITGVAHICGYLIMKMDIETMSKADDTFTYDMSILFEDDFNTE